LSLVEPTSEETEAIRELRRVLAKLFPPRRVFELDRDREFPDDFLPTLGQAGWTGFQVPEEYGGVGENLVMYVMASEEIGAISAELGGAYMSQMFMGQTIAKFGTDEHKAQLLPRVVSGDQRFAFGLSEPNGGSDAANMDTVARQNGGDWVINGSKVFTTLAHLPGCLILVAARSGSDEADRNITLFLVPNNAPGVIINHLDASSNHITKTNQVFFQDVRVPDSDVIGEVGKGWHHLRYALAMERIAGAGRWAGTARAISEQTADYAKERVQFGQPIAAFQSIRFRLVDMGVKSLVAQTFVHHMGDELAKNADRQSRDALARSSMAKLVASETAQELGRTAVQILGGYGVLPEYHIERHARNTLVATIGSGTSEMQREIIGRYFGLPGG